MLLMTFCKLKFAAVHHRTTLAHRKNDSPKVKKGERLCVHFKKEGESIREANCTFREVHDNTKNSIMSRSNLVQ